MHSTQSSFCATDDYIRRNDVKRPSFKHERAENSSSKFDRYDRDSDNAGVDEDDDVEFMDVASIEIQYCVVSKFILMRFRSNFIFSGNAAIGADQTTATTTPTTTRISS